MAEKCLPDRPDLEHLKREARALLEELRASTPATKLADAQRELARQYGFASWARLKGHVDVVHEHTRLPHQVNTLADPAEEFLRLACLAYGNDDRSRVDAARKLLEEDPSIATASPYTMAAVGAAPELAAAIAADPSVVHRAGGPYDWVPLLYVTYSRVVGGRPEWSGVAAARVLLDASADPNAGYLWGGTPPPFTALTGAFGEGEDGPNQPPHPESIALARLLLERGADPNDNQTLYNRHFRPGNEYLELLFEYGLGRGDGGKWRKLLGDAQETPEQMLENQLTWAANRGYADRVELLLSRGVDPNGVGTEHPILKGRNAIECAVAGGHKQVLDLLVAAGVPVPPMDKVEELLLAAMTGNAGADGVAGLVESGRAIKGLLDDDFGLIVLAIERQPHAIAAVAEARRPEAVQILAALGWDVNHRERTTALHDAVWNGDREMVELLLELGADPRVPDEHFDSTPAGWAKHTHNDELHELLEAAAARMG